MRITLIIAIVLMASPFSAGAEANPIPVTTKPLSEVLIERRLTANAQVVAANNSQISAEVSAVVLSIDADLGDEVQAGDVLLRMEDTDWRLQYDQAKANVQAAKARLTQAELRLKRANDLKQSQYISADDLLGRETDVAVFKADLKSMQVAERMALRQLEKTTIKAPFDGVVVGRQAQQGQLLQSGSPVIQLVQTQGAQIHAQIPTHLAAQLAQAKRLLFDIQGQQIPVTLTQLSAVVDAQAAIQLARFNSEQTVPVGQTGQLVWYLNGQLLSADLILKRSGQLGVFVAEQGTARFKPLPDAQEGRPVPINEAPNWQVIIGGRERLQDGQAIRVK